VCLCCAIEGLLFGPLQLHINSSIGRAEFGSTFFFFFNIEQRSVDLQKSFSKPLNEQPVANGCSYVRELKSGLYTRAMSNWFSERRESQTQSGMGGNMLLIVLMI